MFLFTPSTLGFLWRWYGALFFAVQLTGFLANHASTNCRSSIVICFLICQVSGVEASVGLVILKVDLWTREHDSKPVRARRLQVHD